MLMSYGGAFLLYAVTCALKLLRWKKTEIVFAVLALATNFMTLVFRARESGQCPVFSLFDSLLLTALILGLLYVFFARSRESTPDIGKWIWAEVIILFCVALFSDKNPAPTAYVPGFIYVPLFHGFRIIALSLAFLSTGFFIQFLFEGIRNKRANWCEHQGRNYLILAAVLFLLGEYVGIFWCHAGWGDIWMWSEGFFQSTIIVLYLMLTFHIPVRGRRSEVVRSLVGATNGPVMLILMVIRSFL